MSRMLTRPTFTSKKATPYQPPTQPHRTTRRENVGSSSPPTGHVEVPHYPETTGIKWPYGRVIGKRMVGDKTEYMVVWRSPWIPEDLTHPGERGLEEDLAESEQMRGMYPGGPPPTLPNKSLSSSSNVYGENTMNLANMPTSNIDPAMLQHSQLPRFHFDSTVPQPYPIQPSQQQPLISFQNNRTPESEVSDLINHIAELAQTQLGSRENGGGEGTFSPLMQPTPLIDIPYQHTHNGSFESFD